MKKLVPALLALILFVVSAWYGSTRHQYAKNPDPNHTHADFAVWMTTSGSGSNTDEIGAIQKLDFSAPQYMTTEAEEEAAPVGSLKRYLHLHDGNGHVIHRHKPGLTIGDFFTSIGAKMSKTTTDAGRTIADDCFSWTDTAGHINQRCSGEWGRTIHMFVNGKEVAYDPDYVFQDMDHILIVFASDDADIQLALSQMTDDACKYSLTCPWKGPAPTESCISDPTVPCKIVP